MMRQEAGDNNNNSNNKARVTDITLIIVAGQISFEFRSDF